MAIAAKVQLIGAAELNRLFDQLGKTGAKRVCAAGLRAAAAPTRQAIKQAAPVSSEKKPARKRLKSSIKTTAVKRRNLRKGEAAAVIVRATAPHAHLVEQGTKPRKTADGKRRGQMPPFHWMQRATATASAAAGAAFEAGAKKMLEKIAAKGGKK